MLDDSQDVELLDLLDPMRAPLLRSILMETLADRFMRQIAFVLFQRMRHSVQLLSCIQNVITHESAMSALPEVMLAGISELTPLRGRMLLAIDGDLIGAMVDAMCGATSAHPFERYELSALETRVGKQIVDLAFATVSETFTPIVPLELQAIAYENATGMLAIADGQDWMIAVTGIFETELGSGTIRVIVPYSAFETLEAKIANQSGLLGGRGPDENWTSGVEMLTDSTKVELSFELARADLPLAVFQALRPGDVLPFHLWPHAVAVAGGVDLFLADYGQRDGHVCCQVSAPTTEEGDDNMPEQKDRITGAEKLIEPERVELERLQNQPRGATAITAKAVLDRVQVAVAVELGRTQITVKELRALRHGQILQLDQMIGEPLAIFANGQKLAYGEVVAVANDRYGVRVTALTEDAARQSEDETP
ncbi:FliM/FliN family flagellar motor switch protein [Acidocella aminolytica]|jgi:flagellar motor switch protein FliM|uniref:Flagellar motor switch protein FliM n=1 Tax=Acidocella aminolytica 101 = DSM 11237 TaxID=1120923 RepID=A0A0D6PFB6_9PROT|nr:FliM/FliN family flagellar motor switch protein [Acidocella aminolytica]GAN80051.1 flagellar motor switch protein [Acidocella aminolytica 101 = DSM 11237]GBQ40636.1 flagellar motor switch protein FliM [Acidocella aminolytica 101 = DSM 11237]SHF07846.1 flagellar motor switch protein FliM [Acidocella aminolytica 101 = DSM 11237]